MKLDSVPGRAQIKAEFDQLDRIHAQSSHFLEHVLTDEDLELNKRYPNLHSDEDLRVRVCSVLTAQGLSKEQSLNSVASVVLYQKKNIEFDTLLANLNHKYDQIDAATNALLLQNRCTPKERNWTKIISLSIVVFAIFIGLYRL